MYRRKILAIAAAMMISGAMTGVVYAQEMGPGPGGGPPPMMMGGPGEGPPMMMMGGPGGGPPFLMLLRTAKLTSDQKTQVGKILQADHVELRSNFEQLHSIHEKIADKLLSTGQVSASDVAPMMRQAAQLQQQIDTRQLQTALKIRALLTPAQLSKVAQTHQQLKALFQQIQSIMGPPGPEKG
ncbi:MAG TPA: hypothetical protein VMD75_17670 [Candidatus Binataceae bacterium]|nr:hypothetical protein [Candidatus Binataceae bacterium]